MKLFIGLMGIFVCLPVMARLPNIVFLLADDLGYGDLASYGHPYAKTPNIDNLAKEGTRFMRFYVNGNVCNPARTGLMTSRHPNSYANNTIQHGFQDRATITEILRDAGYRVGHFGKWHIGPKETPGTYGIHDVKIMGGPMDGLDGRDAPVYKAAMDFMEANKDVPFYVNVWGHSTHAWINPAASLENEFKDVVVKRSDFSQHMQIQFDDAISLGGNINQSMRKYLGDLYGLDLSVGRLLKKIDDLGLRENTIVVFASDNGPAPVKVSGSSTSEYSKNMLGYAGGLRGHKHTNWEGGIREPFIIRWPGQVPAGKVNTTSVFSGLDWLPTLSSIAGAKINKKMFEGQDVSDIWKGSDRSPGNPIFYQRGGLTVIQSNWKLTAQSGKQQLFDLSVDPGELHDVSKEYPDITTKLDGLIKSWTASTPNESNMDPNVFIPDPVKEAVVIGPADIPVSLDGYSGTKPNNPDRIIRYGGPSQSVTIGLNTHPRGMIEYQVFNHLGKKVLNLKSSDSRVSFDVSSWPMGIYHALAKSDGKVTRGKFFLD